VPSQKISRAPLRCAVALALSLALASPVLHAAGLGRMTIQSALGQPLRAEVEVTSVSRDEAPTLAVRLAAMSAFRQANLEFNPALSALRFDLTQRGEGNYVVRITSLQPVNEPYLDLLLELTWATGRILREYTVLLDPPALRATPDVMAPVAGAAPAVPAPVAQPSAPAPTVQAPSAVAPAPLPALAPEPASAPTAAPMPATAPALSGEYVVKRGDTLGRIALQSKTANVSLDQMLVAMFRANPHAFAADNMNRLYAGKSLIIPTESEALEISQSDARREVVAQSRDFAEYRSRLAQTAIAAAPTPTDTPTAAVGAGRVTTKVEDKAAPATGADQLRIAKVEPTPTPSAAAAAKADEAAAAQRALREQADRAADLARTNEALKKAIELQSKAGTQAQQAAEAKLDPAKAAAPPPAPATIEPAPVAMAPAPAPAEPAKAEAPAPVQPAPVIQPPPPPVEAPKAAAPTKAAPPPAPAATGFLEELLANPTTQIGLGALVVALLGLFGYNIYRRRRVEKTEEFQATGTGLRANSLFGSTGGQSVDTGATSTFNSSFIPAASQLDSNEVDPVAEADVYIAYGREEQAEDILKEALRLQPDRHAVRVKLLEIYSRRGDKTSFNAMAQELRGRTGGSGEDWDRAAKLGRALDPANSMYAGAATAAEAAVRGPTTELRLNPATAGPRPATLGGIVAPAATFGAPGREPLLDLNTTQPGTTGGGRAPDTRLTADTVMQADTRMTADTRMPADTRSAPPTTQVGPTTQFVATLPLEDPAAQPARAGTIDPFGATTTSAIDFSALDFDLGPGKSPAPAPAAFDFSTPAAAPAPAPAPAASAVGRGAIPDVDLNLPRTAAPAMAPTAAAAAALDDSLSRPTLLGDVGALPEDQAPRLTSNTDQATVPLIDFDLSGADVEIAGRRTETQAGSPLAAQMATKLDLARGYIDLGVKDGARELLEEVMRDGTREQRQSAVELMKTVEV
jgi:pilus assembly protein FimV